MGIWQTIKHLKDAIVGKRAIRVVKRKWWEKLIIPILLIICNNQIKEEKLMVLKAFILGGLSSVILVFILKNLLNIYDSMEFICISSGVF